MIAALGDSKLDCPLKIDSSELLRACHSRDHLERKTPSGATTLLHQRAGMKRLADEWRAARFLSDLLQTGLPGLNRGVVSREHEQVLGGADTSELRRVLSAKE